MSLQCKILQLTPEERQAIRNIINLESQERVDEAIDILEEWIRKQEHFTKKVLPKEYIEMTLVTTKGSIENAKIAFDRLFTYRTLLPKYFEFANIKDDVGSVFEKTHICLIPRLSKKLYRGAILRVRRGVTVETSDYTLLYKVVAAVIEYLRRFDYIIGFQCILDFTNVNISDILTKVNLLELQQVFPILTKGYSFSLKEVIFITDSKFLEGFIRLLKPFISEKVLERVFTSRTVEGIKEFMDVKHLPKEYGGNEKSLVTLHNELVEEIFSEEHVNFLNDVAKARTDETKRPRSEFNEEYLGMPGTFRSMRLD